jgi:predicted Fe-Mo cluster-binding NifX family protein
MKIAIPTMDERTLSAHFGRSKAFIVVDVENSQVLGREVRANVQGHQAHGHLADDQIGHGQGHGHHDHGGFVALLQDCTMVLAGGMGAGAWNALRNAGLKVYLVPNPVTVEEAVDLFLAGKLTENDRAVCQAHG